MLCLSIKRPILRSERGSKFRLHVINTFMELEATHFVFSSKKNLFFSDSRKPFHGRHRGDTALAGAARGCWQHAGRSRRQDPVRGVRQRPRTRTRARPCPLACGEVESTAAGCIRQGLHA